MRRKETEKKKIERGKEREILGMFLEVRELYV